MATVGIILQKPCMAKSQALDRDQVRLGDIQEQADSDGGYDGQKQLTPHDSQDDEYADGNDEVPYIALYIRGIILALQVHQFALWGVDRSGLRRPLVGRPHLAHRWDDGQGEQGHDDHSGDSIKHKGNDPVKGRNAAPVAQFWDAGLSKEKTGKEHSPSGEGEQSADRGAGGIE